MVFRRSIFGGKCISRPGVIATRNVGAKAISASTRRHVSASVPATNATVTAVFKPTCTALTPTYSAPSVSTSIASIPPGGIGSSLFKASNTPGSSQPFCVAVHVLTDARKNPLFVMMSTAGTQDSKAMLRWREQGLRAIDSGEQTKLYFAEFSPSPSMDLMTPAAWAYANPALGHTLEMSVIEAESEAPNRNAFLRASVNTWTATQNGWLEMGVFEALQSDEPIPPGGVLAIEVDIDGALYVGVRAVQVGLKTAVTVAFVAGTLAETWRLVEAEIALAPTLRVAITPGLEIHLPPNMERRKTIVGYRELLRWTSPVKNMIIENRIYHHGENQLIEHVERAVLIKHQGSVALSSTRSPGPITLARCMVWAAALASKPQLVGKPLVVTLNR